MTLLNAEAQLQRFINSISANGTGKSLKCSIAIARAYSQRLEMPVTPIGQLQSADYFDMNLRIQADQFLSKVNEIVLIDKATCINLIGRFYSYRIAVFSATFSPIRVRPGNGVVDFFGIDRFFDPNTLAVINASGDDLAEMTHGFTSLFLKL